MVNRQTSWYRQICTGVLLLLGESGAIVLLHAPPTVAQPSPVTKTSPVAKPSPIAKPSSIAPNIQLEIGRNAAVQVLVVGAEPTQKLRLKPAVGRQQTLTMRWNWQTGVKFADQPIVTIPLPTIIATIDATVTQVDRNGDIHYQMRYRDIEVKPREPEPGKSASGKSQAPMIAVFQRQMQGLVGMTGTYVVSDQGKPLSSKLTAPQQFNATQTAILEQFSQSFTNLAAPLPQYAMGVGGKWQQKTPLQLNGATIDQETNYELVGLKDGKATIAFTISQTAKNQTIASPIQRLGNFQLTSLQSQGNGQMVLQLDQLLPMQSQVKMNSTMLTTPAQPVLSAVGEQGKAGSPADQDSKAPPTIETQNQIQLEMTSQ